MSPSSWPRSPAALTGLAIGYLSFRAGLRGSYFALITLAFAEVMRMIANASAITGGAAGTLIKLEPALANFQFVSRLPYFWISVALVAGAMIAHARHRAPSLRRLSGRGARERAGGSGARRRRAERETEGHRRLGGVDGG